VLGWSAEELSKTPFLKLVHPDDFANTVAGFEALQRGEPALRFENRYRRKDHVFPANFALLRRGRRARYRRGLRALNRTNESYPSSP
jgi:hypothetical protein